MVRGLLIRRRFAGGEPSLSDKPIDEESLPSGSGDPLSDDSCDVGGEG